MAPGPRIGPRLAVARRCSDAARTPTQAQKPPKRLDLIVQREYPEVHTELLTEAERRMEAFHGGA